MLLIQDKVRRRKTTFTTYGEKDDWQAKMHKAFAQLQSEARKKASSHNALRHLQYNILRYASYRQIDSITDVKITDLEMGFGFDCHLPPSSGPNLNAAEMRDDFDDYLADTDESDVDMGIYVPTASFAPPQFSFLSPDTRDRFYEIDMHLEDSRNEIMRAEGSELECLPTTAALAVPSQKIPSVQPRASLQKPLALPALFPSSVANVVHMSAVTFCMRAYAQSPKMGVRTPPRLPPRSPDRRKSHASPKMPARKIVAVSDKKRFFASSEDVPLHLRSHLTIVNLVKGVSARKWLARGEAACHRCKLLRSLDALAFCASTHCSKKTSCRKKVCLSCIERLKYDKPASSAWLCPACTRACDCSECGRKGPRPA